MVNNREQKRATVGISHPAWLISPYRVMPLCGIACLLARASAEMATDVPVIDVKPKAEELSVSTSFGIHNNGTKAVRIVSIESSCSCLGTTLDKAVYQPGEKGVGKANFKIGNLTGLHEKSVRVQTDDPAQPEWMIVFSLDVPDVVRVEPKNSQWMMGDPVSAKTARVTMMGNESLKITRITSSSDRVEFSWKAITPGKDYEITIKPTTTSEVIFGALKIETDSKAPKYRHQLAFFSVCRKSGR